MKENNDVEQNLKNAVSASVPDVLDNILSKCETRKGTVISMNEAKEVNSKRRLKSICATAAAIALIVGCTLGFGQYQKAQAQEYTVTIDAQAGIEIVADHNDRVKEIKVSKENTQEFIKQLESFEAQQIGKNEEVSVVVKKIVGFLADSGKLQSSTKPVNVTVSSKNAEKRADIEKNLTELVGKVMESKTISGIGTPATGSSGAGTTTPTDSTKVQVSESQVQVNSDGTSVKVGKDGVSVTDQSIFGGTTVDVKGNTATGGTTVKVTDESPFNQTEVEVVIPPIDPQKQNLGEIIKSVIDANINNVLKKIS